MYSRLLIPLDGSPTAHLALHNARPRVRYHHTLEFSDQCDVPVHVIVTIGRRF